MLGMAVKSLASPFTVSLWPIAALSPTEQTIDIVWSLDHQPKFCFENFVAKELFGHLVVVFRPLVVTRRVVQQSVDLIYRLAPRIQRGPKNHTSR